jgi:hypothetical protein
MINTQFEELRKADRNWKHRTAQEKQVKVPKCEIFVVLFFTPSVAFCVGYLETDPRSANYRGFVV